MRPHVSISVKSVPESIAFYQRVFGVAPQKQTRNYAKFDLKEPALNFSMTSDIGELSRVMHFGIEVDSAEEVAKWEAHLAKNGILELKEENTDCCFARQDKVWFRDPDGNSWEVFFVHEQLPVSVDSLEGSSCCPQEGEASSCCG